VDGFSCSSQRLEGSGALVSASGELDLHTCKAFRSTVDEARRDGPKHLVFDLSEVTYIDSTALGVLLVAQRQMSEPIHIVLGQSHQVKLMHLTGLDEVFTLHHTLGEALDDAMGRAAWAAAAAGAGRGTGTA
jgi:anti-sigma B factor antagonist